MQRASTEAKKLSIEASFVSAGKAPTNTTAEVARTLHLQVVRSENSSLHVVSYLQSLRRRDAGEVGAWIWKVHFEHVTCFSDEKIFRIDAVAPGRSFHAFYREKQRRRNNATTLFGIHHPQLLSHFSRHIPPRSGLPLHGQCSPRCCVARSLTRSVAKRQHFVGF